ncbi:hypothetical protein GW17_00033959 [Ensete ventricosum]|nr:hypothetical protein GW17_00033959 [Ensete ventricosum]
MLRPTTPSTTIRAPALKKLIRDELRERLTKGLCCSHRPLYWASRPGFSPLLGPKGSARAATAGSDEEAREEGEDSDSGRGRRLWLSVRSAQRWLQLRAREAAVAAVLADGRSKGDGAAAKATLVDDRSRGDGAAAEVLTAYEGGEEDRAKGVRLLQ